MSDDTETNTTEVVQPTKKYKGSPRGVRKNKWLLEQDSDNIKKAKEIKHSAILKLKMDGVETKDIAKVVGLPYNTVFGVIEKFKPLFEELKNIGAYRDSKNDILAAGQFAALKNAFSEEKIQKASFISMLSGFEILNKAERLNANLSTENVNHHYFGRVNLDISDKKTIDPEE